MKVGAVRHPKKTKRPPTELEKTYSFIFSVWHPFESYQEIIDMVTDRREGNAVKVVDIVENVLLVWFPDRDAVLRLYVSPTKLFGETFYKITDVVECPDWYEEDDDYY